LFNDNAVYSAFKSFSTPVTVNLPDRAQFVHVTFLLRGAYFVFFLQQSYYFMYAIPVGSPKKEDGLFFRVEHSNYFCQQDGVN
jgi:hypothetical protein